MDTCTGTRMRLMGWCVAALVAASGFCAPQLAFADQAGAADTAVYVTLSLSADGAAEVAGGGDAKPAVEVIRPARRVAATLPKTGDAAGLAALAATPAGAAAVCGIAMCLARAHRAGEGES